MKIMYLVPLFLLVFCKNALTRTTDQMQNNLNEVSEKQYSIRINKCCEEDQVVVDSHCRLASNFNQSTWKQPEFKTEDGKDANVKYFRFVTGLPDCGNTQVREIFDLKDTEDELNLLSDGRLHHIIHHKHSTDSIKEDPLLSNTFSIHDAIPIPEVEEPTSFIHANRKYCIDKVFMSGTNETGYYANVCVPDVTMDWRNPKFIMTKLLNPLFHGIAIVLYLIVAIIYFVLPTLRDLAGNIITTINVCLIVSQAADFIRIFTEYSNHVSFMVTDITLYVSLLGAFFWLNSFGFYIWKTFKSRNVFLRVTDVRKYCYYSSVVWSSIVVMAAMAICAHFLLDTDTPPNKKLVYNTHPMMGDNEQETIGWLGIAIFFTPVAFTIFFNIFFYITTLRVIKRINIYGRIHHKLKGCFDLFLQLFLIMTTAWLFLLLSWLNFDGLVYAHIVVNLLQAILVFYVCVARQSHVTFLLRKSCCYAQPVPTGEWGDEMTHMNGGIY